MVILNADITILVTHLSEITDTDLRKLMANNDRY